MAGTKIKYTQERGDVPMGTEGSILGVWLDGSILAEFPTWVRNGMDRWVVMPFEVEVI